MVNMVLCRFTPVPPGCNFFRHRTSNVPVGQGTGLENPGIARIWLAVAR
jgi:hypothetical protein